MLELIWHGTAAVELKCAEGKVLFDPFIPLKGSEIKTDIADYDGFSDILVTHGHFDHISNLPEIYSRNPAVKIYCTPTPYKALLKKGICKNNLIKIKYGEEIEIKGFKIMPYHGKHAVLPKATPSRIFKLLLNKNSGNILGILKELIWCKEGDETVIYNVKAEDKIVTIMGSMNLREGTEYPKNSDVLILPYNGWEDNFLPAVNVIEKLQPSKIYLDHYDDTFPPVTSEVDINPILGRYGSRIKAMNYGRNEL